MEGPSIVILKEEVQQFKGKKINNATGYAKLDYDLLKNKTIKNFKTWGKHFLIVLPDCTLRIHFLLFGTYFINTRKKTNPKLALTFSNGSLNCYVCSAKIITEPVNKIYDWQLDLLSTRWSFTKVKKLVLEQKDKMICDVILDPNIFAGAGNVIKNEALYRAGVHPESITGAIPIKKLNELIQAVHSYTHDFLKWKKKNLLSKNWKVYCHKTCAECGGEVLKKYDGKLKRRSFICKKC